MEPYFDKYSKTYSEVINDTVSAFGFNLDDIYQKKLQRLCYLFPDLEQASFNFLDYGCGSGGLYKYFSDYFPNAKYIGVDISGEMIREANRQFPGRDVFYDLRSSEWKSRNYDFIFSSVVFHHIPHKNHQAILEELSGILKPAGRLVIWEHNPINPLTRRMVASQQFGEDTVLVPSGNIKTQLLRLPFQQVRILYVTFFPQQLKSLQFLENYLGWLPIGGQYIAIGEVKN